MPQERGACCQSLMTSFAMIVDQVLRDVPSQVTLARGDDSIQTFLLDRAPDMLGLRITVRRPDRSRYYRILDDRIKSSTHDSTSDRPEHSCAQSAAEIRADLFQVRLELVSVPDVEIS
jgi:hypothetical protein